MLRQLASISTLALLARAALTPAQIQSFFVGEDLASLKGGFEELQSLNVTIVGNATHALVALQVSDGPMGPASKVGWLGIGGGAQMVGSDDFVVWPGKKGWVISRRDPTKNTLNGGEDPGDAGAAGSDFGVIDELSTGSKVKGVAQVAFWKLLEPGYATKSKYGNWTMEKGQPFVWARCSTNPGSATSKATLAYHDAGAGTMKLDLSQSISASAKSFGAGPALPKLIASTPQQAAASQAPPSAAPSAVDSTAAPPPPVSADPSMTPEALSTAPASNSGALPTLPLDWRLLALTVIGISLSS